MILVDTGPLVAAINRRDPAHRVCRTLLDSRADDLLVTPYVIAEVCWMAASRIGATAEANVIDAVAAGELQQVTIADDELRRIGERLHQYADLHRGQGLSLADSCVIAVAEHRDVRQIATLDITDSSLVRPRHVPHFILLP